MAQWHATIESSQNQMIHLKWDHVSSGLVNNMFKIHISTYTKNLFKKTFTLKAQSKFHYFGNPY